MRRFPLRLRAALAKSRIPQHTSRSAHTRAIRSPYSRLAAEDMLHLLRTSPVSHEKLAGEFCASSSSIVWLGGARTAIRHFDRHLTRLISQAALLFLDTDGVALRGRDS